MASRAAPVKAFARRALVLLAGLASAGVAQGGCAEETLRLHPNKDGDTLNAGAGGSGGQNAGGSGGSAGARPDGGGGEGGFPCDPVEPWCPYCNDDDDCTADKPYCGVDHLCVGCRDHDDCPVELPVCSAQNTCVRCMKNADCPNDLRCISETGTCGNCADNSHCILGLHCNDAHNCVPCLNDDHCLPGYACDPRTNLCLLACSEHATCSPRFLCNLELGVCEHCTNDAQCKDAFERPGMVCVLGAVCAECATDSDCYIERPICDASDSRLCRQCLEDSHCQAGSVCDRSRFECASTSHVLPQSGAPRL